MSKLSKCCGAEMKVGGSEEGTHYYICTKCGEPCDGASEQMASRPEIKPPVQGITNSSVRDWINALLRLHETERQAMPKSKCCWAVELDTLKKRIADMAEEMAKKEAELISAGVPNGGAELAAINICARKLRELLENKP